jgi:2-oxoisovalerate dehydrogenase E1 component
VRATPIAETAIIGAAVGAAIGGLKPVAEIMFLDFLGVCLDQIANHAAKVRYMSGGRLGAPLTIRITAGAGSGPQHSQALEAWLAHVPGLKVVWPSTAVDAAGLLRACLDDPDPCVFVESMALLFGGGRQAVPLDPFVIPIGLADVKRPGRDVTVVAYGTAVPTALAAAGGLAADGARPVDVEVIDLRSLLPLDVDTVLTSVARTGRAVVAHEAVGFCGIGAEVAAIVSHELHGRLAAPVERVTGEFTPVPRAAELEALHRPGPAAVAAAVRRTLA